jgi:hypothetical protein
MRSSEKMGKKAHVTRFFNLTQYKNEVQYWHTRFQRKKRNITLVNLTLPQYETDCGLDYGRLLHTNT